MVSEMLSCTGVYKTESDWEILQRVTAHEKKKMMWRNIGETGSRISNHLCSEPKKKKRIAYSSLVNAIRTM